MGALFASLWARFHGWLLIVVGAAMAVVLIFYRGKTAGREQAVTKQREVDDEARKRMHGVKPADSGSTIDSLRNGKF